MIFSRFFTIEKNLLKIIKNKDSYIEKLDALRNPTKTDEELFEEKKQTLISARKQYLESTDYKVLKAIENETKLDEEIKTKRAKTRQEINEINVCKDIDSLSLYSTNL